MYTQAKGSSSTLRSHSSGLTGLFSRFVASGLATLLLLGSGGLAQAQTGAGSESVFIADGTTLEPLVVTAPAESTDYNGETVMPPRPPVRVHEVENKVIKVEGNLDQSIAQDLERLEEATRPPCRKWNSTR